MKRGKILVIRGGAIGDFILTVPALTALKNEFSDNHIEVLGYPKVAELARAAGIIDGFRSIEAGPLARFFARNAVLDPEWSAYFGSFNAIFSYLYDPDEIFKTNIGRVSKAQFIQGQHRPLESENIHATAVFLKPLEQLAIFDSDPIPHLKVEGSQDLPEGTWLAAHPGSGSEKKNWPEEKFEEALRQLLLHSNANILLVGGEAEGERLTRIKLNLSGPRVQLAQNLPLAELAGLMQQCRAFLGHDSGITHLAIALGLPAVVLWGPSNSEIWRPLNPGVEILKPAEGLETLPVSEVINLVQRLIRSDSL